MGRKTDFPHGGDAPTNSAWTAGTWSTGPPQPDAPRPGTPQLGAPYVGAPYGAPTTQTWTEPASTTSLNPWLVVGFAVVVFVVAIGVLVVVVTGRPDDTERVAATSSTTTSTSVPVTTSTEVVPPAPVTVTSNAAPVPALTSAPTTAPQPANRYMSEADALYGLQAKVDGDRAAAEELVGSWVPQISSKRIGLDVPDDDRGPYTAAMVLSDHLAYEDRYEPEGSGVLAIQAEDFNFKVPGYVVTIVALPFSTGAEANSWCDDHGIGVDDCFAKHLAHDGDWKGSVLRRK